MPHESPKPIDYVRRWWRIVTARRKQHDAACAVEGRTTGDYWARRAEDYRKFVREATAAGDDPFLASVLRRLRPEDTVLDVGAGTGRHTIPLARHARRVVAIDPSPAMLRYLHEDVAAQGLSNVEVIEGAWPEAAERAPQADIVISAHVLYPIEEVVPFLRALDGHARRLCFLHLMVWQPWFDQLGLWEAVHGEARLPQPCYIDAVNALHQLGCYPNVEIAWVETPRTFDGLDDALERFADTVAVGDDPERRRRLREALAQRLEPLEGGRLAFPQRPYPVATVWWEVGPLGELQGEAPQAGQRVRNDSTAAMNCSGRSSGTVWPDSSMVTNSACGKAARMRSAIPSGSTCDWPPRTMSTGAGILGSSSHRSPARQ